VEHDHLVVEIGGTEIPELYDDLITLEVELDDALAGMVRMTLAMLPDAVGVWPYLDDGRIALWARMVVTAGFQSDAPTLFTGFVTHLRPEYGSEPDQCRLHVWAMDASVLMDRAEKLKDWPNKKDSDIARETFAAYGLDAEIVDTEVVHDEDVSTIIQRETDFRFLRRLALRNGFECFVDGDRGYFRPPTLSARPQPVLSVQFGDDTDVHRFSLEVNALTTVDVAMVQVDRVDGSVLTTLVDAATQNAFGTSVAGDSAPPNAPAGLLHVSGAVTTGDAEMSALCRGLRGVGEWFVTGQGEITANAYGSVLIPRAPVTIKGIGELCSGVYVVTHVTHRFTEDGYEQQFRVKRNALRPTGTEDFDDAASGPGGLVAAAVGSL